MSSYETGFILEEAKKLAAYFRDSTLYLDYCRYKEDLEKDPLLTERVRAYKKIQIELETKRLRECQITDIWEEKQVAYE